MWITRRSVCLVIGLALATTGCSKYRKLEREEARELPPPKIMTADTGRAPGATGPIAAIIANAPVLDRTLAMNELRTIHYCYFGDGVIPPPENVEDFKDLQKTKPKLYDEVKKGHYVVYWKANRNAGNAILAYWKHTPEIGGIVLLVNGETPMMTPEEFKNAPKAGN